MATLATLTTLIQQEIQDPNADEVTIGASSVMVSWINRVLADASKITDCLQNTGSVTGNGTLEAQVLPTPTTGSTLWRILSATDRVNGIIYLPCTRREYQAFYGSIVTRSAGGGYYYNLFGFGTARKLNILPIVANNVVITVEFSETHPTLVYSAGTETPSGLLGNYDELVIDGVCAIYYGTTGDERRHMVYFTKYMDQCKRLASEVGTNPEIKPEMSSLYRTVFTAIRDARQ